MTINLGTLRKIAKAATPGPWEASAEYDTEGRRVYTVSPEGNPEDNVCQLAPDLNGSANVEHIATFDPPTVLALLSRLEQAEQAVKRKQSALDTVARIVETQCEAVVLATDSQDLIGDDLDGDWDAVWGRLSELADAKRTAEQAVQRVREAVKDAPTSDPTQGFAGPPDDYPDIEHFIGNGEWTVAERVRRALDGDGRG